MTMLMMMTLPAAGDSGQPSNKDEGTSAETAAATDVVYAQPG